MAMYVATIDYRVKTKRCQRFVCRGRLLALWVLLLFGKNKLLTKPGNKMGIKGQQIFGPVKSRLEFEPKEFHLDLT